MTVCCRRRTAGWWRMRWRGVVRVSSGAARSREDSQRWQPGKLFCHRVPCMDIGATVFDHRAPLECMGKMSRHANPRASPAFAACGRRVGLLT
jgi:hypothetical protein